MPLSDHQLVSREPLPVPEGDDWREWGARLIVMLDSELNVITQSAAILPIYDTEGRLLIDQDGIYAWDAAGALPISPDIVQIDTQHLVDAAITTLKIANLAVDTAKLAALAVNAAKIATDGVIESKILAGAVTELKIAALAVTEGRLASLSVTAAKLAAASVGDAKLDRTTDPIIIDTVDLAALAAVESIIGAAAVTATKLGSLAVTTAKIDTLAVTTGKIALLGVNTAQIALLAVDTAQIALAAVDSAQIKALAVGTAAIALLSVGSAQIASAAIIEAKIASLSVATAAIQAAAIGTAQIANLAVTSALIGNLAVVSGKIDALAVNTAEIANLAVGSGQIDNLAVTQAKIALLAIDRAQISNTLESDNWNNTTKAGIHINFVTGAIQGQSITIYNSDGSGDIVFSSGGTVDFASIIGATRPEDNADVTEPRLGSLLLNGSFETGDAQGWILDRATIDNDSSNAHQGTYVLRQQEDAGGPDTLSNLYPTAQGERILIECYAKRDEASLPGKNALLYIREYNGVKAQIFINFGANLADKDIAGYQHLRGVFEVNDANAEFFRIDLGTLDGVAAGHWFFDEISFARLPKDADIDALLMTNAPVEAGADVTSANVQPGSWLTDGGIFVTAGQITSANISTFIANVAIQAAQIALLAVGTAQIALLSVGSAQIAALAVTEAKIGALAVTSAKIGDLQVQNAHIENLTIATGKVIDDAITKMSFGENASNVSASSSTWVDVVSISFTKDETSSGILVEANAILIGLAGAGGGLRIVRDSVVLDTQSLGDLVFGRTIVLGAVDSPSSGSYVYKLQVNRLSGSGAISVFADDGNLKVQEFKK